MEYVGGDANRDYSAGATTRVYIDVDYSRHNELVDGLLAEHNQDGTHSDVTADTVTATTVTADSIVINGAASSEGWAALGDVPDTVTANGNRSYDLVFNGNDLTDTISPGMRLQLTRTVAAPDQCTSLNGSSQYWSKSSPAGMTFTDDFSVSAWVKLSSYGATSMIASRYNGTSGWDFFIDTNGTVVLQGRNGGSTNYSRVYTYQSIPLNKWVHISAQLDMSAFTATTTTSYVMIDGVDVPATVLRSGTNPTALIQAGNLEIGSNNGGTNPFPGKLAQVAIYSAKVTQATHLAAMNQGLTGSETSLISAYSFDGTANDLNANANNLSANGSATATNDDSPFENYGAATNKEYAIVMAASFSTNTTLTVQVPEGCAIPTSGGVSAVYYSTQDVPYGFPRDKGRWKLLSVRLTSELKASPAQNTWYTTNMKLAIPAGAWRIGWTGIGSANDNSGTVVQVNSMGTTNAAIGVPELTTYYAFANSGVTSANNSFHSERSTSVSLSTLTPYYLNMFTNQPTQDQIGIIASRTTVGAAIIYAENAYV